MTSTTPLDQLAERPDGGPGWPHRLRSLGLAAGASALVNLIIWAVARIADVALAVPETPGGDTMVELTAAPVLMSSILPVIVGFAIAVALARWVPRRAATTFTVIVVLGFVLSFVPLLTSDLSTGTAVTVGLMHPVVAAAALVFLRPLTIPTEARRD